MSMLPTNIDATYEDDPSDPSVKEHQQHHDAVHDAVNRVNAGEFDQRVPDPTGQSDGRMLFTQENLLVYGDLEIPPGTIVSENEPSTPEVGQMWMDPTETPQAAAFVEGEGIFRVVAITQAAYNALPTPRDETILYVVVES